MDSYENVRLFLTGIVEQHFGSATDDALYELHRTNPARWIELSQDFDDVLNPPRQDIGSLHHHAVACEGRLKNLENEIGQLAPELLRLMLGRVARHYVRHAAQLELGSDSLNGDKATDLVAKLLKPPQGPAEPPLPDD